MGVVGIIGLAGVVVNNGIILVDVINNITINYLKEFEIYCPTNYLPICNLYSILENKILLNRKINQNLRASRAQSQTQFELCRGAAVNAGLRTKSGRTEFSLLKLAHSSAEGETDHAA